MPLYSKDSQICRSCWWPLSCNGNNCWQYDTRLLNASPLLPLFSAKLLYVFSKGQFDSSDLSLFTPLLIFWHFQTCWTTLVTAFGIFLEAHFWSVVLGVVFLGMHQDRELLGYILQPTVLDRVQGYKRMDLEGRGGLRRNKCPFLCGSSLTAVGLTGKCEEGLERSVPAVMKHSLWKCQALAPDWRCAVNVAVIQAGSLWSLLPFESLGVTRAKIPPRHSTDYTQVEVFLSWRGKDSI